MKTKHLGRLLLSILLGLCLSFKLSAQKDNKRKYSKALDVIATSMALLDRYFVDSIDMDRISRLGISAMLGGLDPYTEYYSKEDNDKLKLLTTGEYAGIGSIISQRPDSTVLISSPMEGMPAAEAGLRAGDIILEIDGKDYRKSSSELVSTALKGTPGSKITILIQRRGETKPKLFSFHRRKIIVPPIPWYGISPGGYGYIALNSFTNGAASLVRKALVELQEQHQIKGLILDLRGNGGGLIDEAVKIVSLFVPEGSLVVSTRGRADLKLNETFRTKVKPLDQKLPLTILIDGQSASASEIVAGALQDMDRAVVLGSKSFGKGLVQSTLRLPHDGTLKLTTAKYYIPSGRCIQRLDYHEARSGKEAKELPDSLKTIFYTARGREVLDAGGIIPDVTVQADSLPTIIYYLSFNTDVFDWITDYRQKRANIAPAKTFCITDEDYKSFSQMLESKDFNYDQQSLKTLEKLKEVAEFEGHLLRSRSLIDSLQVLLEPNLKRDLETLKPNIRTFINSAIIERYYYRRGVLERNLLSDKVVLEAEKYLSDIELYNNTLNMGSK